MRLDTRGEYPPNWPAIAEATKDAAGWRCVRCRHPFYPPRDARPSLRASAGAMACDAICDPQRCPMRIRFRRDGAASAAGLCLTVHHLDGDKANCRWWNLLATCNACHLSVQARVIPERPWLLEHSPWFLPFVCGFYAWYYEGIEITRDQAERESARWLIIGQPWREEASA